MNVAAVDVRVEAVPMDALVGVAVVRVRSVATEWDRRGRLADSVRSAVMRVMQNVDVRFRATSVSPFRTNHQRCVAVDVAAGLAVRVGHHHVGVVETSRHPGDLERRHRDVKIRMLEGQRRTFRMPTYTVKALTRINRRNGRCAAGETNPLPEMSKASRIGNTTRRMKDADEYFQGSWNT